MTALSTWLTSVRSLQTKDVILNETKRRHKF